MNELSKIKEQIEQGQGLTCAQARILWEALGEANQSLRNYQPTPGYLAEPQNAFERFMGFWLGRNA